MHLVHGTHTGCLSGVLSSSPSGPWPGLDPSLCSVWRFSYPGVLGGAWAGDQILGSQGTQQRFATLQHGEIRHLFIALPEVQEFPHFLGRLGQGILGEKRNLD